MGSEISEQSLTYWDLFIVTITEALKIEKGASRDAPVFSICLACGFTPLHLRTFLSAHLQQAVPDRRVQTNVGVYGDTAGTIEGSATALDRLDGLVVALEWLDLDARLDFRNSTVWAAETASDIVNDCRAKLDRIVVALSRLPSGTRVSVSLPTLPLPPFFHTPGWQTSQVELQLERAVIEFACQVAESGRANIVNASQLAEESPAGARFDLKSDLLTGLPYTMQHADMLARSLARNLLPASPKKGIISDLDDTLWRGIVGEVGPDGVSWDLAGHAQLHGLYQELLSSLSHAGVLVGIASKNDPAAVDQAFARPDLLLRAERVYPIEAHWNPKSGSVQRILETWNIGADSVIFVDDSPMELGEVASAHPGIECILFPKEDMAAGLVMLKRLRDLCGRERTSRDDGIRLESIRQGAAFRGQVGDASNQENFLKQVNATIVFDETAGLNPRVLELVNKTNQFNLNGVRYLPAEWERALSKSGAVVLAVDYEDKFGRLGTISVVLGTLTGRVLNVQTWVLSCRAFTRRIEHQTLKALFEITGAEEIDFQFCSTAKNGPVQEFLVTLLGQRPAESSLPRLTLLEFTKTCPELYHKVRIVKGAEVNG